MNVLRLQDHRIAPGAKQVLYQPNPIGYIEMWGGNHEVFGESRFIGQSTPVQMPGNWLRGMMCILNFPMRTGFSSCAGIVAPSSAMTCVSRCPRSRLSLQRSRSGGHYVI